MKGNVLSIIKQAASELGLPVPNEGVASKDQTSVQLVSLLNSAGYDLIFTYDWDDLIVPGTITTVAGQEEYDLPSDYARLLNQTMWADGGIVSGPISPQQWQVFKAGSLQGQVVRFRIKRGKILLNPIPAVNGDILTYEYISDGWIESYTTPGTYTNLIPTDQAIPIFDFFLMVKFLKLKMWQAKGFNTDGLIKDLDRLFVGLTSANGGRVIYLNGKEKEGLDIEIEVPTEPANTGFPYSLPFRLG